ncbi:sugar ABC transporter substrate-binding protein [Chloroflexia bacterium SDU3-3]|nr:sugar ABC transporter substrate-binding protein [Chloroflexia bacterium SDU3-3]
MATIATACGTSSSGSNTAATSAAVAPATAAAGEAAAPATGNGPTEITWMIWADDVANDKNMQNEIKLFNDSQSEVKVNLIGVPWGDFDSKLQAMIAADTPPDVVAIKSEGDYVSKGFMLPIDDLIKQDNIDINKFVGGAVAPAYDGKIYGFGHDTAYWLLYYNKDMFDAAGIPYPSAKGYTIDEFMDVACKLSKPDQGQWGMHNFHWIMSILAQQQGIPYLNMVDGQPKYQLDDPKTVEFFQKVSDFINVKNCQLNNDQSTSLGGADPFIAGKAAMSLNGNWGFGNVKDNAQFNWGVAPIPGTKQPNVGMKIGIAKTSKNQAAAWKFLKWLTYEPEATRYRAEHGMGQPALNDEQAMTTFISGPASPAELKDIIGSLTDPNNSFKLLDPPGIAEASGHIQPASDEVMQGLAKAADVLPAASAKANEVLAKEWAKANASK